MSNTKYTALFLGELLLAMSVPQTYAQVLQPIGTLTISDVTTQPISIFRAGVGYALLGTGGGGGGGAPEPASFTEFTLTKLLDSTSPMLLVNAASGRLFAQARIDLFGPDGQTVLTSYELFDILVLSAVVSSVQGAESRALLEDVSLEYQRIKQTVFTPAGPVAGCWDRRQNQAC